MLGEIGEAIGLPGGRGVAPRLEPVIERLSRHSRATGLRSQLREFGIERGVLSEVAGRIFAEPGLAFNPRPVDSIGQILEMLERAW